MTSLTDSLFGYFWIVDLGCRLVLLSLPSCEDAHWKLGQVTKSLGKKTVNFDINGIAAGVNMEVEMEMDSHGGLKVTIRPTE